MWPRFQTLTASPLRPLVSTDDAYTLVLRRSGARLKPSLSMLHNQLETQMPTLDQVQANKPKRAAIVADVERSGEKLIIPSRMTLPGALKLIQQRIEFEEQEYTALATFDVLPADGAVALAAVIERLYGWTPALPIPGFFGDKPPQMRDVEVAPGKHVQVPWGRMALPNVDGYVETHGTIVRGMACFALAANVKRKDAQAIDDLFAAVRAQVRESSIYRGQAVRVRFTDSDGDSLNEPEVMFIDTSHVSEDDLIFSRDVEAAVRTNLFVPITRARDCLANGIPVKRGVLLGGTFGTGKTLAATVASMLAVRSGITFLYVARAAELAQAIAFAKRYQSPACAIFCEDIDRATGGERSVELDEILNTIDGIDSKDANLIIVLTTNNLDGIHPAMLRPGRLDAVIEVTAPDAEAVQRLLRSYAQGAIAASTDLTAVGHVLAGTIPAVVAEVVKRAKLAQLGRQEAGSYVVDLSADALLEAARTMQRQMDILKRAEGAGAPRVPDLEAALQESVRKALNGSTETIDETHAIAARIGRFSSFRNI
jgi:transitional endoplasmic reticulum ATPase